MNASPLTRLFAIATVFAAAAAAAPAALAQTEGTALSREEVKQETLAAMAWARTSWLDPTVR